MEAFKRVFKEEDYKDFINITNNKELVSKVDTSPIDNYDSCFIDDKDKLKVYYQNIKYYLDEKNLYAPKLREGIAIVASKVAIIADTKKGCLEKYYVTGDNFSRNVCNPFEEVARLLMNAIKKEFEADHFDYQDNITYPPLKLEYEEKAKLGIIKEMLNNDKLIIKSNHYSQNWSGIVKRIGDNLERSNITSSTVVGNHREEYGNLLLEQFDAIFNQYQNKLDINMLATGLPKQDTYYKLVKRFSDKVTYAKRNIGMYSKTKQIKR